MQALAHIGRQAIQLRIRRPATIAGNVQAIADVTRQQVHMKMKNNLAGHVFTRLPKVHAIGVGDIPRVAG